MMKLGEALTDTVRGEAGRARFDAHERKLVSFMGVAQIVSWGTLYYCVSVLAVPIAASFGVDSVLVFTAFTVALFASGLAVPFVGRAIDRYGGRVVLSAGSLVAALAFAILGTAQNIVWMFTGWIATGIAMSATLYDAGFATLHQVVPKRHYRRAVTVLTLFGGFASTVFWPLSTLISTTFDWRITFLFFAVLHAGVCLPIHFFTIPRRVAGAAESERERTGSGAGENKNLGFVRFRDPRYLFLTIGFAAAAFIFSAVSSYSIPMLSRSGLSMPQVLFVTALIGPLQVAGRLVEWAFARRVPIRHVGVIVHSLMLAAMVFLGFAATGIWGAVLFAVTYGLANGVMTIVRGTVPVALFGNEGTGSLLGGIAFPSFVARALAPALFASIANSASGSGTAVVVLVALAGIAGICYLVAIRKSAGQTEPQSTA